MPAPGSARTGFELDRFRRREAMSREDLWVRYVGLGGIAGLDELRQYLAGGTGFSRQEHNTVALALNEHYSDHGKNHPVPYVEDDAGP